MIRSLLAALLLSVLSTQLNAQTACQSGPSWYKKLCLRHHQIIEQGDNSLFITGYAWHNRHYYPKEKTDGYNEAAWGGGYVRDFYDAEDDWHAYYAMAFLDSHKNVEPLVGYTFLKMIGLGHSPFKLGLGWSPFITARPDIFKGIPFPGALPLVSLGTRAVALYATYIPGAYDTGNVLFLFARVRFPA